MELEPVKLAIQLILVVPSPTVKRSLVKFDNSRLASVEVKKALPYVFMLCTGTLLLVCRGVAYTAKSTVSSTDASRKVAVQRYFFF